MSNNKHEFDNCLYSIVYSVENTLCQFCDNTTIVSEWRFGTWVCLPCLLNGYGMSQLKSINLYRCVLFNFIKEEFHCKVTVDYYRDCLFRVWSPIERKL